MKNVLKTLAKRILISLRFTAAASATDAPIDKKIAGSGMTALIVSNEELNNMMKIVTYFEESSLLIKDISETIKKEVKDQKNRYPGILIGTLGASLLGNLSIGKRNITADEDTIRAGEGTIRAGQDF